MMGGFGSGRPSGSGRGTVEACRLIDASRLHKTGCLRAGWAGGMAVGAGGVVALSYLTMPTMPRTAAEKAAVAKEAEKKAAAEKEAAEKGAAEKGAAEETSVNKPSSDNGSQ